MSLTYPTAAALLLIALGMLLAFSILVTPVRGFKDESSAAVGDFGQLP